MALTEGEYHPSSCNERQAGVLLHLSSLPEGTLGNPTHRFLEFLAESGHKTWQVLPICPPQQCGSPYSSVGSFAGNEQFIDLTALVKNDLASGSEITACNSKEALLKLGAERFITSTRYEQRSTYSHFCRRNAYWLDDFCLFRLLTEIYPHSSWLNWPEPLKRRDESALAALKEQYLDRINVIRFTQYLFDQQWRQFRIEASKFAIKIFGDLPLFVDFESADCWAHPTLFKLDENCHPTKVAGVPPDYFSSTGQIWGNPSYRWPAHANENFRWWQNRFKVNLERFDLLRIDHFRGLTACWEIPIGAEDASTGRWVKAPGAEILAQMIDLDAPRNMVAEDLGTISPDVLALRDAYSLAGMKVLQFGFDGNSENPHNPRNISRADFVYTGTHDNNTSRGWFEGLHDLERRRVKKLIIAAPENAAEKMIEIALHSAGRQCIIPMQDWLNLSSHARMNTPGTINQNWAWQMKWEHITPQLNRRMRQLLSSACR